MSPYAAYVDEHVAAGVDTRAVLLRELRAQGYAGGYTTLKYYVRPRRRAQRQQRATVRFETAPEEQARVGFGHFR